MPPRYTFDAARPVRLFYAAPVPDGVRLDPSNPKWIQLCAAGSYVYRGEPVTITPATFDQMIANFRAHPSYDAGARNLFGKPSAEVAPLVLAGRFGVVALNFDHPPLGGPRPGSGWILELDRRDGELWGLCWFGERAYAGMLSREWSWTSIEWTGATADPKTGKDIGAYLSGVALTNDPFIQGMQPIQMSRCAECEAKHLEMPGTAPPFPPNFDELFPDERRYVDSLSAEDLKRFAEYPWEQCIADQKKRGYSDERAKKICGSIKAQNAARMSRGPVVWFGPATDVLCELRACFGLPETADVGAVIGEVAKLRSWALGQSAAPIGVDVGGLVGRVRMLLALPTLSEPANIFAELDKLLGRLADEQQEEPMNAIPKPNEQPPVAGLARMFSARLSALLRTVVTDDEPSLAKAFDAMSGRYDEAMAHVDGLKKAFGTDDAKSIGDKIVQLIALQEQFAQLLGEVKAEHDAEEKAEGDMAAQDVQQVMAAQRLDPTKNVGTLKAYTAQRLALVPSLTAPTVEEFRAKPATLTNYFAALRTWREKRAGAQRAFFAEHGIAAVIPVPAEHQHLYGPRLFAGPGALFGAENIGAPPPAGQQQGQAPQHFAQPYQGVPLGGKPPLAPPAGWSWARVSQLPPGVNGDNFVQRIFDELVRTEFNGSATGPAYDRAFNRANQIANEITRREGAPPSSLLCMA
jgi:hypothetical protein